MPAELDYDEIAARIHGYYMAVNSASDLAEYGKLPEFLKIDNREAALRIGNVLAMAGLRLEPRAGTEWPQAEQEAIAAEIERNLDLLAEAEHDGWTAARLRHGWKPADCKNIERREHHLLVPYAQFPAQIQRKQAAVGPVKFSEGLRKGALMTVDEEVDWMKELDRNAVRKYVEIIARTKYRIVVEGWDDVA